jgi:SAM-dependent methyltransferase
LEKLDLRENEYILVTVHREGNRDDTIRLRKILAAIEEVDSRVIFPVHPRTRKVLEILNYAPSRKSNFCLIVCSHILEHLRDPMSLVRSLLEKTRVNGCIFIEVPNQDYLYKPDTEAHLISPPQLRQNIFLVFSTRFLLLICRRLERIFKSFLHSFKMICLTETEKFFFVDMMKYYMPPFTRHLFENIIYNINTYRFSLESIEDSLGLSSYGEDRQWIRVLVKIYAN